MSPSMRDNRQQTGKFCHNASNRREENLDRYSGTTSNGSDDDRRPSMRNTEGWKQGKQLLGMISKGNECMLPPPPPPAVAPRTRLKSAASLFVPKTALASQAPLFVPGGAAPPVQPAASAPNPGGPSEGKECLLNVIKCTLGSELWDFSMVDCINTVTGDMYTAIDVTIPALSASMCHVAASQDPDAIAAGQQATQFQAIQSLLYNFQGLAPKVSAELSADTASQLSVKYCAADKDMLCWEFSHKGFCPRWQTCRWAHAMVETFVINLILQPLMNGYMQPINAPQQQQYIMQPTNVSQAAAPQMMANTAQQQPAMDRWVPMRPPAMDNENNTCSTLGALPMTNMNSYANQAPQQKAGAMVADPDETPWPDHVKDISFGMEKQAQPVKTDTKEQTPTSRRIGRKNWADIQEESDDEPYMLSSWSEG